MAVSSSRTPLGGLYGVEAEDEENSEAFRVAFEYHEVSVWVLSAEGR